MRLPAPLAGWERLFEAVPDDVREAVVGLATRLAPAIGSWHPTDSAPGDDVDGVSGLERRGPYDRLLLSEWALADEAPLEFLRRAAEREHLFLDLARSGRAPRRRSVVIFDGGPGQLGAPRVAHLALVILLAQRASRAGADFWWTVAPSTPASWSKEVDPTTLPALFHGRSARRLAYEDLPALFVPQVAVDDLWVVGDAATPAPDGAHRVVVDDVLDEAPGTRRLEVRVSAPGQMLRTVELEMPPAPLAARILANPFRLPTLPGPAPRPRELPAPRSRMVFAASAPRLFALHENGLWSLTVPTNASDETRAMRYDLPGRVDALAVQYATSNVWLAHAEPGRIVVTQWQRSRRLPVGTVNHSTSDVPDPGAADQLGELYLRPQGGWYLRTHQGELWRLWGSAHRIARGVVAMVPSRTEPNRVMALVSGAGEHGPEHIAALERDGLWVIHGGSDEPLAAGWFGHAETLRDRKVAPRIAAAVTPAGAWVQWGLRGAAVNGAWLQVAHRTEVAVPDGATPVGAFLLSPSRPLLLVLSADRHRLEGLPARPSAELPILFHGGDTPILEACVSPAVPVAALLTGAGEVLVCSLRKRAIWTRATLVSAEAGA